MNPEFHLQVAGIMQLLLGAVHVFFPRYFNWKLELSRISLINRQMMVIHSFFIGFVVALMGLLCLTTAHDLVTTKLGRRILLGMGVFWAVRLLIQFFGYSPELWRRKRFETGVHILFSLLWIYFVVVFWVAADLR